MKKTFIAAIAMALTIIANAETVEKSDVLVPFHSLEVSNAYHVELRAGSEYSVKYTVDARIADYCNVVVQGGNLLISVDEKSYPKELKNQLKKEKNLELKAIITVPDQSILQNIKLSDNVKFRSHSHLSGANSMTVTAGNNTEISALVLEAKNVTITASNKAKVNAEFRATAVTVNASNNANLKLEVASQNLEIKTEGSADVVCNTRSKLTDINASLTSTIELKGASEKIVVKGKNYAKINAGSCKANDADITLNSCDCSIQASQTLRLNLASGAKLTFDGTPSVTIDKIASSSVIPARESKK